MQVKILKKTKNELKIELDGEGHTLCNVIQKALLKDKRVDFAGYDIQHPLTASPVIYLRTKARSKSETILKDAAKEVQKDTEIFRIAFDKALKKWQSKSL